MLQEAHAWRERCLRAEAQTCQQAVRPVLHVMAATDVDVLEDQKGRLPCWRLVNVWAAKLCGE
jgi:hypothetical protein